MTDTTSFERDFEASRQAFRKTYVEHMRGKRGAVADDSNATGPDKEGQRVERHAETSPALTLDDPAARRQLVLAARAQHGAKGERDPHEPMRRAIADTAAAGRGDQPPDGANAFGRPELERDWARFQASPGAHGAVSGQELLLARDNPDFITARTTTDGGRQAVFAGLTGERSERNRQDLAMLSRRAERAPVRAAAGSARATQEEGFEPIPGVPLPRADGSAYQPSEVDHANTEAGRMVEMRQKDKRLDARTIGDRLAGAANFVGNLVTHPLTGKTPGQIADAAGFHGAGADMDRQFNGFAEANEGWMKPVADAGMIAAGIPGGQAMGVPLGGIRAAARLAPQAAISVAETAGRGVGALRQAGEDVASGARGALQTAADTKAAASNFFADATRTRGEKTAVAEGFAGALREAETPRLAPPNRLREVRDARQAPIASEAERAEALARIEQRRGPGRGWLPQAEQILEMRVFRKRDAVSRQQAEREGVLAKKGEAARAETERSKQMVKDINDDIVSPEGTRLFSRTPAEGVDKLSGALEVMPPRGVKPGDALGYMEQQGFNTGFVKPPPANHQFMERNAKGQFTGKIETEVAATRDKLYAIRKKQIDRYGQPED